MLDQHHLDQAKYHNRYYEIQAVRYFIHIFFYYFIKFKKKNHERIELSGTCSVHVYTLFSLLFYEN